jgi:RNA polymerase sigma factor for flagellar operon FliA
VPTVSDKHSNTDKNAGLNRRVSGVYTKTADVSKEPNWALVKQYLPLVKAIIGRMRIYFPPQVEMEDMYSIAISGLIHAIRKSDPDKMESFGSYATLRIKGAVLDELRKMDWMPRAGRMKARKLRQTIDALEQELKRPALESEVAVAMGLSIDDYRTLLDQVRPVFLVSMDTPLVSDKGESASIHELVSDQTQLDARERIEKKELVRAMKERIESLPDIHRKVLTMYYFEEMRLAEIAVVFDLTESRICQIHAQAVMSLRSHLDRVSKQ